MQVVDFAAHVVDRSGGLCGDPLRGGGTGGGLLGGSMQIVGDSRGGLFGGGVGDSLCSVGVCAELRGALLHLEGINREGVGKD